MSRVSLVSCSTALTDRRHWDLWYRANLGKWKEVEEGECGRGGGGEGGNVVEGKEGEVSGNFAVFFDWLKATRDPEFIFCLKHLYF